MALFAFQLVLLLLLLAFGVDCVVLSKRPVKYCNLSMKSSYLRSISTKVDLILGTGSKTRRDILTREGFKYTLMKADINEKAFGDRSADAMDLVRVLAIEKAQAIMSKLPDMSKSSPNRPILLTADQVVTCNGQILEKPRDEAEAREFIAMYNGGNCTTVGSIALTDLRSFDRIIGVDSATIYFSTIPEDVIDKIMREGQAVHCAGGLMVEHPLLQPYIIKIDGTTDSVIGLSCELLEVLFRQLDIE